MAEAQSARPLRRPPELGAIRRFDLRPLRADAAAEGPSHTGPRPLARCTLYAVSVVCASMKRPLQTVVETADFLARSSRLMSDEERAEVVEMLALQS